jgi:hypothetical protein
VAVAADMEAAVDRTVDVEEAGTAVVAAAMAHHEEVVTVADTAQEEGPDSAHTRQTRHMPRTMRLRSNFHHFVGLAQ